MTARETDKPRAMLRQAARLAGGHASIRLPRLIALTDPRRLPDPVAALSALPRGAALIWRAYEEPRAERIICDLARRAGAHGVLLLVAGDARMAMRGHAGGLHLPERALRGSTAMRFSQPRRARPDLVVTAAAHSEAAIIRAARAGVDAVLISPVFATQSHPGARSFGIARFAKLAHLARRLGLVPYALGGVTNSPALRRLNGTGAYGIAGIGFLAQA